MKALMFTLLFNVLLKTCNDGVPDQVGRPPQTVTNTPTDGGGGGSTGGGTNGTTDAPIDGGLSILLVAGAAYGIKRFYSASQKGTE